MERSHCYALLAAVGQYEDPDQSFLPAWKGDLQLMQNALVDGLRFPGEHIRTLGENGILPLRDFVRALQEFTQMLSEEDLLLLYFSGHGNSNSLCFTDGSLSLKSFSEYLQKISIRNRILILDCCQAGSLIIPENAAMQEQDLLESIADRGMALMASSASTEAAWMGNGTACSLFTEAMSLSMCSGLGIREGKKTLFSVMEYARAMMTAWNRRHPEHAQHPVFRADMIGTVTFSVRDETPYTKAPVHLDSEHYQLYDVRSISTVAVRRLTAFLVCDEDLTAERIAGYTKEAAEVLRVSTVANNPREETRFRGVPARAVWCYFGRDLQDMLDNCYAGYGLWTADDEIREQIRQGRGVGTVHDGIFVWMNSAYQAIRRMRGQYVDREEYVRELQSILSTLVNGAETFIEGLHRWENGEIQLNDFRVALKDWNRDVQRAFVAISDTPNLDPEKDQELRDWSDAILELAVWASDLAIPLTEDSTYDESAVRWLLQHAAERYYAAIADVREAERKCRLFGDLRET